MIFLETPPGAMEPLRRRRNKMPYFWIGPVQTLGSYPEYEGLSRVHLLWVGPFWIWLSPRWEIHAAGDLLETRVGMQSVELVKDIYVRHFAAVPIIGFLEPIESQFILSEPGVHDR